MFLIDTDVLSELRKRERADAGVRAFFQDAHRARQPLFLSVITVGEVRCGIERVRSRGDEDQARRLAHWLEQVLRQFEDSILPFDADCAQVWGALRARHPENPLDKQIAATALVHGLTVVTGNAGDFSRAGVAIRDPFTSRGR